MQGTLTLFRPSILDPVEDLGDEPAVRGDDAADLVTSAAAAPAGDGERRFATARVSGGGPTLDDLVVGVWEGLVAHRTVACPACGGAMAPRYGAGSAPVGGRCASCRTTIM